MEEATRPVQERPREECHAELGDYFNAAYVQQHAVDEAAHGLAQPCGLPHLEGEDRLEAVDDALRLEVPRRAARELVGGRQLQLLEAVPGR